MPELDQSAFPPPLADVIGKITYRRVSPDVVLDPVYRLRYEAYRRENFIPVNYEEICRDDLDDTPNGMTFGVYLEEQLIASIRIHILTPQLRKSPSMKVFPDILGPWLDAGLTFMDPSRFTVDKDASLALPALPYLTLRLSSMAAEYFNTDYTLSLVRPEHGAFYRRVFRAEKVSDIRRYPDIDFDVMLFRSKPEIVREPVKTRFPIFKSLPAERNALFGTPPEGEPYPDVHPSAMDAHLSGHPNSE